MGKVATLGAMALGATAAYYFLGPKGKKHQASAKKWGGEVKKKIAKEIEKQKELTQSVYEKIIDKALESSKIKDATSAEVISFAKALKQDWKHVLSVSKDRAKKVTKNIKSKAKKIAKA